MLSQVKKAIVVAAISLSEVTGASQYMKMGLILNKNNIETIFFYGLN